MSNYCLVFLNNAYDFACGTRSETAGWLLRPPPLRDPAVTHCTAKLHVCAHGDEQPTFLFIVLYVYTVADPRCSCALHCPSMHVAGSLQVAPRIHACMLLYSLMSTRASGYFWLGSVCCQVFCTPRKFAQSSASGFCAYRLLLVNFWGET